MHKVESFVTYKDSGVCKIVEENRDYFILEPVYSKNMTMYVPKQTQALVEQMKPVPTKKEIDKFINDSQFINHSWIEDSKLRYEEFNEILKSGNKDEILWLIKVLSQYKKQLEDNKKNFYASDKRVLTAAEKVITEEFAFVLEIEPEEVMEYVNKKLGK